MERQEATDHQDVIESTVNEDDDAKKTFEASSSEESNWACIDDVSTPADDNVRVLPGRNFYKYIGDQFKLHEVIGKGSQGKVYNAKLLAEAPNIELITIRPGDYAVKVFYGELLDGRYGQLPEELFGFHADCQFVCRYYGYFIRDDSFHLVMQKYDCSLRKCIDKHMEKRLYKGRPFHGPVAMMIIIQVAIGMAYLHLLNIVHRDLKADNIFVMKRSEEDCGPAGVFIGSFDSPSAVIGTGFWRAPEILRRIKELNDLNDAGGVTSSEYFDMLKALPLTTKSDVYSFGMTCYEILTGRIPFEGVGLTNFEVVLSGERPKLPSNVNPKMRDLLHKCWDPDPDARPSFADIVSELKGFVQGIEAYKPMFNYSTVESRRIRNSSLESNLSELKDLVRAVTTKYPGEDFVVWAIQFADAIEQYKVEYGLRSIAEQPVLPCPSGLSRVRLLDTIQFRWSMFQSTCPTYIPECVPFCRIMEVIVCNKMVEGLDSHSLRMPETPEEVASWTSIWNAWEEEKQKRPDASALVNRHEICHDILRSKAEDVRNRDEACHICKDLPFYAPQSTVDLFRLYSEEGFLSSLKRVLCLAPCGDT